MAPLPAIVEARLFGPASTVFYYAGLSLGRVTRGTVRRLAADQRRAYTLSA